MIPEIKKLSDTQPYEADERLQWGLSRACDRWTKELLGCWREDKFARWKYPTRETEGR